MITEDVPPKIVYDAPLDQILVSCYVKIFPTISKHSFDRDGLSITSFIHNSHKDAAVPSWLDYTLGSKSVYFGSNQTALENEWLANEIDIEKANAAITSTLTLPSSALSPLCSIELLGYVAIDIHEPFIRMNRFDHPLVGTASLAIPTINHRITCYYRALFENWRPETAYSAPNYWSIVFYCPILEQSVCNHLDEHHENEMNITFIAGNRSHAWSATFDATSSPAHSNRLPPNQHHRKSTSSVNIEDVGICVSIPYNSVDIQKRAANGAILQDWIRYYLKLGLKIMIYDRDGSHYRYINRLKDVDRNHLEKNMYYFTNTIRGILDPSSKGLLYDNNEIVGHHTKLKDKSIRSEIQGHDKVLSLTQCRFDMKALLGIENVFVSDFDEFLYCPHVPATAAAQARQIKYIIEENIADNITQIEFIQRVLMNKTSSIRDCVIDSAQRGESVLQCYAPYEYVASVHSIKSVHLGHKCPLTGYHQACHTSSEGMNDRTYDCQCNSRLNDDCEFIHFSTKVEHFQDHRFTYSATDKIKMADRANEVYKIIYAKHH